MNAAASTAAYFQTAPLAVASPRRRAIEAELVPPPPPVLPMMLTWLVVAPFLCLFWGKLADARDREDWPTALFLAGLGAVVATLAILPTRRYFKQIAEYRGAEARVEAAREKELEEEEARVGVIDGDRDAPPP
jgi:hypothetical protein